MRRAHLGEFEEIVLLTVGILQNHAYSVAVFEEIKRQTGRSINISAVHSALYRLEEKGYLTSRMGDATSERGGKRKRIFVLSAAGKSVLDENMNLRNRMYDLIPKLSVS